MPPLLPWQLRHRPWIPSRDRRRRNGHRIPRPTFFCSNRHSNTGCGRTFSIHWDDVIPRHSLPAEHLAALVRSAHEGRSIHRAWAASKLWISLTSAYRWLRRWKLNLGHIRTRLCLIQDPPGKTDFLPDPLSVRHLLALCPVDHCPVANFQQMTQTAVTG
jgi:hypothetical protein